jgi:hypothetical protein
MDGKMNVIEIHDGGLVFNQLYMQYNNEIQLVIQTTEENPIVLTGYCWPEEKDRVILQIREAISRCAWQK